MASIARRATATGYKYQVQVRVCGVKPVAKTFEKRSEAEAWAKAKEEELRTKRRG